MKMLFHFLFDINKILNLLLIIQIPYIISLVNEVNFELLTSEDNPNILLIPLTLQNEKLSLILSFNNDKSLISLNNINNDKNKGQYFIQQNEQNIKGTKTFHQNIKLGSDNIELSSFAYEDISNNYKDIPNNNLIRNGMLSLSKKSENNKFNILHLLNEEYKIKKNFKLYKNKLSIGLNNIDLNNALKIPLVDIEYKWGCKFQGILVEDSVDNNNKNSYVYTNKDDNLYILDTSAIFDSFQRLINSEANFMYFLKDKIFKNLCKLDKDINHKELEGFICSQQDINKMSNNLRLSFIFNNHLISTNIQNLFLKISESQFLFVIVYSKHASEWTFGSYFFNDLFELIFNAEDNELYIEKYNNPNNIINFKANLVNPYKGKNFVGENYNIYDYWFITIIIINIIGIVLYFLSFFGEKAIKDLNVRNKERIFGKVNY